MSDTQGQGPDFSAAGPVEYNPSPAKASGAIDHPSATEEARLLAIPGVVSVGIGAGPVGDKVVMVGVVDAGVGARLPHQIGGMALVVTVTGPIDALPAS